MRNCLIGPTPSVTADAAQKVKCHHVAIITVDGVVSVIIIIIIFIVSVSPVLIVMPQK